MRTSSTVILLCFLGCASAPHRKDASERGTTSERSYPLQSAPVPSVVQVFPSRLSPEAVLQRANERLKANRFKYEAPVRTIASSAQGKALARSTRTFDVDSGVFCGDVAEILQVRVVDGPVTTVYATCYQERSRGPGHWLDAACEHTLVAECPDGGDRLIADLAADAALSL